MSDPESPYSKLTVDQLSEGVEFTIAEDCKPYGDDSFVIPVGSVIRISNVEKPIEHIQGHNGLFSVEINGKLILCNFRDLNNFIVEG